MRLDYKSIIVKHYVLHLSGAEIASQLNASKSGVNGFLKAFKEAEEISFPLPPGITNEGILDFFSRMASLILVFYLYKWMFVQEYVFIKGLEFKQAAVFGIFVAVAVINIEKIDHALIEILVDDCYFGPEKIHVGVLLAFLVCDAVMWIIGVFKPEAEAYRLHGPSFAAAVAFFITALQALPEYITVRDEVFARAVIEKVIIFLVIKMHYRFPLSLKLTVILVAAFLIMGMAYGYCMGIRDERQKKRKEQWRAAQEATKKKTENAGQHSTGYSESSFIGKYEEADGKEARSYNGSTEENQESEGDPFEFQWEERDEAFWREYWSSMGEDYDEIREFLRSGKREPLFFVGCNDLKSLKKQYREYCKELHPDNLLTGDEALFKKMLERYEELKKSMPA